MYHIRVFSFITSEVQNRYDKRDFCPLMAHLGKLVWSGEVNQFTVLTPTIQILINIGVHYFSDPVKKLPDCWYNLEVNHFLSHNQSLRIT